MSKKKTSESRRPAPIRSSKWVCGVELIAAERKRQKWSAKHDDGHIDAEIAEAARCCLQSYVNGPGSYHPTPWDDKWRLGRKHNKNPKRLLAIAGALIAAELDRLNRPLGHQTRKRSGVPRGYSLPARKPHTSV